MYPQDQYFKTYFEKNRKTIVETFNTLLRYKSISSDPECNEELVSCASFIQKYLQECGCTTELWGENCPPIVFGKIDSDNPNAPTVLIYNHYDVQPVDPIEKWHSNPFSPTWKEGTVYARGSQDNKGQLMYVLTALKALATRKQLPCNLRFLIEGEEENGSATLEQFLPLKKDLLRADYTMIVDASARKPHVPAINVGCRGLVALTLTVDGTFSDLHSGMEGGLAYNPLHATVKMLSALRDDQGRIQVPHFYDDVAMPDEKDRLHLSLDFDEKEWEQLHGQKPTGGERDYSPLERNWFRPTLEINGIHGGYGGAGTKTVIPRTAVSKITCRLVPNQEPQAIAEKIKIFLEQIAPPGVTVSIYIHEGKGKAFRTSCQSRGITALQQAMQCVYQTDPELILDGATIPIIPALQEASSGEILLFGTGLPTDFIHAPNEHFDLERMEKGFLTICQSLHQMALI